MFSTVAYTDLPATGPYVITKSSSPVCPACGSSVLNRIPRRFIDRLISIAESRRNASLHEIERRRAILGETLRRSVQEIEDGEFEVIETTPAQGKNVA